MDKNKLNLLDLATIKLGLATSSDAVSTVKAATEKLQDSVLKFNSIQLNEFMEEFANKVLTGSVFKRLQFQDKFSKHFFKEGTHYSALHEVSDVQLLNSSEYDQSQRILDKGNWPKGLRTIIKTKARKYLQYTFNYQVVKAAFASPESFGAWYQRLLDNLTTSLQVEMYHELSNEVKSSVVNTIDAVHTTSWDTLLLELNEYISAMALPTNAYNIGYESKLENGAIVKKDDSEDANRKKNVSQRSDLILITTPKILNSIKGRVLTSKIHNEYFKMENFADIILLPNDFLTEGGKEMLFVVDKDSFYGRFRIHEIATQSFAANLETDTFLHYWYLFGMIPWANGFKFTFTLPTVDNEIVLGKITQA